MHANAEATVKIPLCCGVSERCRLHGLKWGEQLLRLCYVHKCQLLTVTATSCVTAQQQQQQQRRRRKKWFGRRVPKSSTLRYYCMPSVDGDCCPSQVINILLEKLKRSLQLGYTFRLRLDAVRLRFDVEQQSSGCRIAVEWESNGVRQIEVGSKPNRRRNHA